MGLASGTFGLLRRLLRRKQASPPPAPAGAAQAEPPPDHEGGRPLFSVIMATRNRAHCICEAIDAVFASGFGALELIVIDDGSEDGTSALLAERYESQIKDGHLVLCASKTHIGVSAARNRGLELARGEWIAYADSDNQMRPCFFDTFTRAIADHPAAECFYARFLKLPNGRVGGLPYRRGALLRANFIDLGAFVHRADLFTSLGGFDTSLRRMVDWDLIIRYTEKQPPVFLPTIVLNYDDRAEADRITTTESAPIARLAIAEKHGQVPTVTTAIVCYNQQDYIAEAIESALRQTGYFAHEILISDDGSTDATREIVQSYAQRYPYVVRDVSRRDNRGMHANYAHVFRHAAGQFVAILEGDDYWTDNQKLEKQIRFLSENEDCAMVFSKIEILEMSGNLHSFRRQDDIPAYKLTGEDLLADKFMNPIANFSSCMFRANLMREAPPSLFGAGFSEIGVAFHLERQGKIGFIGEAMSVYRKHECGQWAGATTAVQRQRGVVARKTAKRLARPEFRSRIQAMIDEKFAEDGMGTGS